MDSQGRGAYQEALKRIEECRVSNNSILDLAGLGLTELPPEIDRLLSLTELDLANNQLTSLPPEIGQLSSLTDLTLNHNKLSLLPPEIGQISTLNVFDICYNELRNLPSEIGMLSSLQRLYLYNNNLSTLPPEIGNCVLIQILSISDNQLISLPPEIGCIYSLQGLYPQNNKLFTLPSEIGLLPSLTYLNLSFNPLDALPASMQNLRSLKRLFLRKCPLRELPNWLRELPTLEELNVAGCAYLNIPTEIAGPSDESTNSPPNAKQVLDYYFSRLEQGERPLNEVKLLLVGRGEAGKTCVSRALRGLAFDSGQKETPGIEIHPWTLQCPEQEPVKVHLWDFAGQEITHETHRFFLTERSLYLVVLDGRTGQQMEEAEYWLSHVKRYGTRCCGDVPEASPVIVVLNKWESPGPYEVEKRRLQREYPNIVAFVNTDCKSRLGIAELEQTICTVLEQMPGVRQKWPLSYYNVRELLDKKIDDGEHFMTWEAFRKTCAQGGEPDKGRQQSMAENLNALGVALYYGEHEHLRDTRVLNPNWAANGLYGLIRGVNKKPHNGKSGYLWAGAIADVLAEGMMSMESARGARIDDYPVERNGVKVHEFLLDLMVDRELGFQAETFENQPLYLLPGLLSMDEPDPKEFDIAAHIDKAEVRFRYLYEVLPAGVMSRFIVRTHPLSEGLFRWQRGVVLGWGEAKGLVLCERHRNPRLNIYIAGGTDAERQALAGVVRTNLEMIHRGLPEGLRGIEELDLSAPGEQYEKMTKLVRLEREGKPVQVMTPEGAMDLPVEPELRKVQPAEARREGTPELKVFISYAHNDSRQWDRLRVHLDVLYNEGLVKWWFDGKIRAGSDWDDAIRQELKDADIVVLMMSNSFFASSYITGMELKVAMRRKDATEIEILPVLLEDTPAHGRHEWLKKVQAAPVVNGKLKPLTSFNPRVNGWSRIEEALRSAVAAVAKRRRRME